MASARETVIVLDAGTGGGRAVAVDAAGRVRARAYRRWSYFEPPGLEMLAREFHPHEFKALLAACCREVMTQIEPSSVIGVTTTSMRQGCVFLDKAGKEIYGGSNHDVRGLHYAPEIENLLGEERTYRLTGHWPPWLFLPARLYWFKEEKPDLFHRIGHILMINDWLIYWLSGEMVSEPTNAAESLVFDIDHREWSEELMALAGIRRDQMPPLAPPGTVVASVSRQAAEETGLPPGVKVLTGMADTQAALLAAGVMKGGEAGIVAGSTAPVMMVIEESRRDPEVRLWIGCHPLPGRWVAESNAGDAGILYRLYVEGHLGRFAGQDTDLYSQIEGLAGEAGPGAAGARAFLGPLIWDLKSLTPAARAGIFFSYPVSERNAHPGIFARAILENIAFALQANVEQAAGLVGEPSRVTLAGGLSRSNLFCRIVAGVLGRKVEVVQEAEATALGCALPVFTALGVYPDWEKAGEEMRGELMVVEPDSEEAGEYADLYEEWREEYKKMMGIIPE